VSIRLKKGTILDADVTFHGDEEVQTLEAEVERLQALAEQRFKDREYWQERNAEKETENDRLRKDLARADSDAQALYEAEVERLRAERDRYERTLKWYATNAPDSVAQHVLNGESLFNAAQGGEPDA
jgi:chromosome segregation ATPase